MLLLCTYRPVILLNPFPYQLYRLRSHANFLSLLCLLHPLLYLYNQFNHVNLLNLLLSLLPFLFNHINLLNLLLLPFLLIFRNLLLNLLPFLSNHVNLLNPLNLPFLLIFLDLHLLPFLLNFRNLLLNLLPLLLNLLLNPRNLLPYPYPNQLIHRLPNRSILQVSPSASSWRSSTLRSHGSGNA